MAERRTREICRVICGYVLVCLVASLICGAAAGQQGGITPADGATIFAQRCAHCHGDRGQGIAAAITIAGPCLQAEHDMGNVMTAVESGPGHMPAFSRILAAGQIRAVSQYVISDLAVTPLMHGNIGEGGRLFRMYCATCHRTAVRGGVLAFAGRNAPDLQDKSSALIAGAIRWEPGTMPAFPPSVLSDEQLGSTVDYVHFVQHPPTPAVNLSSRWVQSLKVRLRHWSCCSLSVLQAGSNEEAEDEVRRRSAQERIHCIA